MLGESAADLTSVQVPEICKGLQGVSPAWDGGWNAVPCNLPLLKSLPPSLLPDPSVLTAEKKQSSSKVSAATPTYTLEWLMCIGDMAHVIGGSFTKWLLRKHSNTKIIVISTGFTFWKVHIQNTIHSLTLKHPIDIHAYARWMKSSALRDQWKRIRSPRGRLTSTGDLPFCSYWCEVRCS